jgi:hypothetical protein
MKLFILGLVYFEINVPNRLFIGSYSHRTRKWSKKYVCLDQNVGGLFPYG